MLARLAVMKIWYYQHRVLTLHSQPPSGPLRSSSYHKEFCFPSGTTTLMCEQTELDVPSSMKIGVSHPAFSTSPYRDTGNSDSPTPTTPVDFHEQLHIQKLLKGVYTQQREASGEETNLAAFPNLTITVYK